MSDLQLIPVVIAIVGLVRAKAPKIDGLYVWPVAFAVALLALFGLTTPTTVLDLVRRAVHVSLEAMGILLGLKYGAAKLGEGVGKGVALSIRPPPPPQNGVKDEPIPQPPPLPTDPTKAPLRVSLAWATGLLAMALAAGSCGYGKAACTVVDVAHEACAVIRYLGPDGKERTVRVSRESLQALAEQEAAKQAAQPDGGAP